MKKLFAVLLMLIFALTLCACNKDKPTGNNVPDNVIPPKTTEEIGSDNSVSTPVLPDEQVNEVTSAEAESEVETQPSEEEEPSKSQSETDDAEVIIDDEDGETGPFIDISEVIDIHEYKTFECLYLLNSDKVHAKFMEAVTYDGEYVSGTEREIFILGDEFAYVTDGTHIVATKGDDVVIIDYDNEIICTYEGGFEMEEGDRFGYGIENYKSISVTEEDGVITEVFEIETFGGVITSTWTFRKDNTIIVTDVIDDSGAYYVYDFEKLEKSFSQIEMQRVSALPAPNNLREISVEEYEENY